MPTLTLYALPDDGTLIKVVDQYTVRTAESHVWAGYNTANGVDEDFKAYLVFDTTGIPTGATITAAVLSVYVDYVAAGLPGTGEVPVIQLLHSPWTLPLDATDWADTLPPSGSIQGPAITLDPSTAGTTVTYNVTNLSVVVVGGTTSLRLVHALPFPTDRYRAYVRLGSGNNPDTAKRPTLVVTYTPPPPPVNDMQATLDIEGQLAAVPGVINDIYRTVNAAIEGTLAALAQTVTNIVADALLVVEGTLTALVTWFVPPAEYPINASIEGMFEAVAEGVINPPPGTIYVIVYTYVEGAIEVLGYTIPRPPTTLALNIEGRLDATASGGGGGGGGNVILQKTHMFTATAVLRPTIVVNRVWGNPTPAQTRFLTQISATAVLRSTTGQAKFTFTTTAQAVRHRTVLVETTAVTAFTLDTTTFRRR